MPKKKAKKQKKAILKMDNSLSIYEVNDFQERLMGLLQNNDQLEIDLDPITECDVAGIQLLYSARKTADKMGKELIMLGSSRSLEDTAVRAGLSPETFLN